MSENGLRGSALSGGFTGNSATAPVCTALGRGTDGSATSGQQGGVSGPQKIVCDHYPAVSYWTHILKRV